MKVLLLMVNGALPPPSPVFASAVPGTAMAAAAAIVASAAVRNFMTYLSVAECGLRCLDARCACRVPINLPIRAP